MNLGKNWDLQIDLGVFKSLKKFPHPDVRRILDVIYSLPFDLYFGDIQKLKGEGNSWRRRVGNYRIFYKIKQGRDIILVFRVERRATRTYRKR